MAYGNMTPAVSGGVASSVANNVIITNVDDLDTRVDAAEAAIAASGSTGSGNATLSTRLGVGVTTASTATTQFTSVTGRATALETTVNNSASLGSGNNAMNTRIGTLRTDVDTLLASGTGVAWTERTGTSTTVGTGWTEIPFATSVTSGAGVSVLSGVGANAMFALTAGVWTVSCTLRINPTVPETVRSLVGAIFRADNNTDVNPADGVATYAYGTSDSAAQVTAVSMVGEFLVPVGQTWNIKFSAAGSIADPLFSSVSVNKPRVTFKRLAVT